MGDIMRPIPYKDLVSRALDEYAARKSIFDVPHEHFYKLVYPTREGAPAVPERGPGPKAPRGPATPGTPPLIGPAAGPHTQLAQNILCAWLAGARWFELKTVQILDELSVEKPCIDAADEGYNVEWSTELTLDGAYDEYLKAWFVLHVFESFLFPPSAVPSLYFNMSVGYDLKGIKSGKMDRYINRLIDSSRDPLYLQYVKETAELAEKFPLPGSLGPFPAQVPPNLCSSVTLSTMHGCPPGEIEAICAYLMTEKKLDTMVKLNPTLLGFAKVSEMLTGLGYGYVELNEEGFTKDLQYADALPMLRRLAKLAKKEGRSFGVKLSNTLAAANRGEALPGKEMYMSGRALYPLTVELAARIAKDFNGGLPISFCGGVSAWNLGEILATGIAPVTLATDLLKPGGYGRLKELAETAERAVTSRAKRAPAAIGARRLDVAGIGRLARDALGAVFAQKVFRGTSRVRVEGPLPLFDCFVSPCVRACPIAQDVPEYVHLAGAGQMEKAFAAVWRRNPLPFITSYLCDHKCMDNCTRMDWEGPVGIRNVKRICSENGYKAFYSSRAHLEGKAKPRGLKAAVIGAGPAGLAAAAFLAREGFETQVFERERDPGGVVRYLLPGFRLPAEAVEKDVSLLFDLGIRFYFGARKGVTIKDLQGEGYRYVVVATGAESGRDIGLAGALDALSFLRRFRNDPAGLVLGRFVAVIGAGDTAMDAARAAKLCPGVAGVTVVYRRSEAEMPASVEEYQEAREAGIEFRFLVSPEKMEPKGRLLCRVMELDSPDEGGRKRPVPTDRTESIEADTVIAATGAEVDRRGLEAIGLFGEGLKTDPRTQETGVPGVFLVGDAASGAQTIVKAIASARRAVEAIVEREGGSRYRQSPEAPEDTEALRSRRDRIRPALPRGTADEAVRESESLRCLGCGALCLKCVEVCPNRANTAVRVADGFRDAFQIIHLDGPCNECGNCATFCPWDGKPYRDKLTLYGLREDFNAGENPGFFLSGRVGALRLQGRIWEFALDGSSDIPPTVGDERTRAVIGAILRGHSYLLSAAAVGPASTATGRGGAR